MTILKRAHRLTVSSADLVAHTTDWKFLDDTLGSDHFPIISNIEYPPHGVASERNPIWTTNKANRKLFTYLANINIAERTNDTDHLDIEEKTEIITSCIIDAAKESYPLTKAH